uniref:ORF27 n=1 Tax=Nitrosopumilaceae spindle-shaped virus TaxID=3065433 RepID=A0AAT9J788_9VIRU
MENKNQNQLVQSDESNEAKMSEQYGLGYSCCYCKEPIKDKDIPREVLEKISMQLVWHMNCEVEQ